MNDVLNYTDFALESSIESLRLMNKHRLVHLALESEFILECIDCGVLSPVFEADKVEKTNSLFARVKDSIRKFFQRVIGLFKDRSKEKAEKYVPWIKDNIDSINERSQNMTLELTPYWKTNWRDDIKQMTNASNKIFDNIKNGKFDDYSFADNLVKIEGKVSETPNLKEKLIVRFSIGEKDKTSMQQVKVENFGKTGVMQDIFKYTLEFTSEVNNAVDQLGKTIDRKMDQVSPKTIKVKESNFFDIEGSVLCETDLVTLINYMEVITEGNNPKNTDDKNKGTVDSDGDKTTDTSVKVNPDGDEGAGTPEDNEKDKNDSQNESNEEKDNYISECELFLKAMISSFLTAAEKRFVGYVNAMIAIGGAQGSPTRDEDGTVEDKEESKEEPKKEKKKESPGSRLVKGIKNFVNKN